MRQVLLQCLHARRTEEDNHVVIKRLHFLFCHVIAHRSVHHTFGMFEFLCVQQVLEIIVVNTTHRNEILLGFMLDHQRNQVGNLATRSKKHLAFAILYIFLDVQRNGFKYTEVLHVFRYGDAHLLGQREKMVYRMARSEHNS